MKALTPFPYLFSGKSKAVAYSSHCLFQKKFCFQKSNFEKEHGELTLEPGGAHLPRPFVLAILSAKNLLLPDSLRSLPCLLQTLLKHFKKDTLTVFERVPVPHMTTIVTPRLEATRISIHSRINESCVSVYCN